MQLGQFCRLRLSSLHLKLSTTCIFDDKVLMFLKRKGGHHLPTKVYTTCHPPSLTIPIKNILVSSLYAVLWIFFWELCVLYNPNQTGFKWDHSTISSSLHSLRLICPLLVCFLPLRESILEMSKLLGLSTGVLQRSMLGLLHFCGRLACKRDWKVRVVVTLLSRVNG